MAEKNVYEEWCTDALDDAREESINWMYFLLKAIAFALLYIGRMIKEK